MNTSVWMAISAKTADFFNTGLWHPCENGVALRKCDYVVFRENLMKFGLLIAGVLSAALITGVAVGVIHYRPAGICLGKCNAERRQEFRALYYHWYRAESLCGDTGELDVSLLIRMAPDIHESLIEDNRILEPLADREAAGTLTVAERQLIERRGGRYMPSSPSAGAGSASGQLLTRCPGDGFIRSQRSGAGFCLGYAYRDFSPFGSAAGRTFQDLIDNLYAFHRRAGDIEGTIKDMRAIARSSLLLEEDARAHVLELPASEVRPDETEREINRRHRALQCDDADPA